MGFRRTRTHMVEKFGKAYGSRAAPEAGVNVEENNDKADII